MLYYTFIYCLIDKVKKKVEGIFAMAQRTISLFFISYITCLESIFLRKDHFVKEFTKIPLIGVVIMGCITYESNSQTTTDSDGDELIEIVYIEDLDAIRYNLTGTCSSFCSGYELTRNLDFNNPSSYRSGSVNTSYTTGSGWIPIGTATIVAQNIQGNFFDAVFEGNAYTINNLYINRRTTNIVGLFGITGTTTTIKNLCLRNVSVLGNDFVGGLVGYNFGGVIDKNCATGYVDGNNNVGGLVGVNYIYGVISQSYATGSISGDSLVGGLVGSNPGSLTESNIRGIITQSYATGDVSGSTFVGGLVGINIGYIDHTYWNKNATQTENRMPRGNNAKLGIGTDISSSYVYIKGFTLAALQSPTGLETDSIRELGPGFVYIPGHLPAIHTGARLSLNNVSFTQTTPSITNIGDSVAIENLKQGTVTTRATVILDGIHFTADVIDETNITYPYTIQYIENGTGIGIIGSQNIEIHFTDIGNKTYGDAPFLLSAISSSGLSVSYFASNTLLQISGNTSRIQGVGTVSITAYIKNDTLFGFASQILTINKKYQSISLQKAAHSISFGALGTKTFGNEPFVLSARSSASLPVVFSASNTLVTININTVTLNGAGTVNIIAYSTGNINYLEASETQTLVIHEFIKVIPSLAFNTIPTLTVGQIYPLMATSNSSARITINSSNEKIVSVSGTILTGTIAAIGTGTVIITASQQANAQFHSSTTQQTVTVINANILHHNILTFVEKRNPAIHIFPNPAQDYLTIQSTVKIEGYSVYGLDGSLALKGKDLSIHIQSLKKGEYILVIYGERIEVLKVEKIIKE